MMRIIEAVIDKQGRVSLKETVKLEKTCRALVTILDDKFSVQNESLVGTIEIIDEDLETAGKDIAKLFHDSLDENRLNY